ncbi:hypothetical protein HYPSUDRAFT_201201 [Hypholoma sublateritium FD-334 SS-4]|uniref:Antifreeze protein n=1 Tax=Hypholoma sublateritium (strain FD-334 SS-4) TaxID=945553 RepID=A0A0D2PWC6_HYPSF|nr:hypothetical protein HYPSUDRAFT_201201 [Hypholoma sublateritium FD-334 SS-4]
MFSVGIQTLIAFLMISAVSAVGPTPINLRSVGNFTIFAKTGVSTVPTSAITGDVGVSPSTGASLTGFSLTMAATGTSASSIQVVGNLFASDFKTPTPAQLTTAALDLQAAFNDGNSRQSPNSVNLLGGGLTAQTLSPGLYEWTTSVNIITSLTLTGSPTDVWIFQVKGDLLFDAGALTTLAGGALSKNIFWVVSGSVTLEAAALLEGVILGATNVALVTGASVNGRILAQTAVTLQESTVKPA